MYVDALVGTVFGWLVNIDFVQTLHDAFQNWRVNPGYLLELQVSAVSVQSTVQKVNRYAYIGDEACTKERDDRPREGLRC